MRPRSIFVSLPLMVLTACTSQKPLRVKEAVFIENRRANVEVVIPTDISKHYGPAFDVSVMAAFFHGRQGCPDITRTAPLSPGLLGRTVLTSAATSQKGQIPADENIYVYIEYSEAGLAHNAYCGNGFRFKPESGLNYRVLFFPSGSFGGQRCVVDVVRVEASGETTRVSDLMFAEKQRSKESFVYIPFGKNLCEITTP